MKMSVKDLLGKKKLGSYPLLQEDSSIKEALLAFKHYDSGAVMVMRGEKLVGLYSERDFARTALKSLGKFSLDSKISEAMSRKVIYVTPAYHLGECIAVMAKMNISFLPVIENERPIAMLSTKQIMEALIGDQEFMIGQLVQYVTGSHSQKPVIAPQAVVKTHTQQ